MVKLPLYGDGVLDRHLLGLLLLALLLYDGKSYLIYDMYRGIYVCVRYTCLGKHP